MAYLSKKTKPQVVFSSADTAAWCSVRNDQHARGSGLQTLAVIDRVDGARELWKLRDAPH
jgi:hypothetical protein